MLQDSSLSAQAIEHIYAPIDQDELQWLQRHEQCVVLQQTPRIRCSNAYYQQKLVGTLPEVYIRQAVYLKLLAVLECLAPHIGLCIFDGYRSIACQQALFDRTYAKLRAAKPHLTAAALNVEVRKYVAHPDEPARFAVPPHNSGGAIDLTLIDVRTNQALDFGTDFDDSTLFSQTDYFEQAHLTNTDISQERWQQVRENRRLLFNAMKQVGFVNFVSEWWHYDLGDCLWSEAVCSPWFYPSMEQDVLNFNSDT